MEAQTKEAARQILGHIGEIQAKMGPYGVAGVNQQLIKIRKKAAALYEGDQTPEKIIDGYRGDTDTAFYLLYARLIEFFNNQSRTGASSPRQDADRLHLVRMMEVSISRARVYFERKTRCDYLGEE